MIIDSKKYLIAKINYSYNIQAWQLQYGWGIGMDRQLELFKLDQF